MRSSRRDLVRLGPVGSSRVSQKAVGSSTDGPWRGDAVSLVESYRRGERDPVEVIEATLEAIEASDLNAFSYVAADEARMAAKDVDLNRPLAGVPFGVKEIEAVSGWPFADASLVLADRRSARTSTNVARLIDAGAIPVGQTTSSEMARASYTATKLHGVTRNPWNRTRTPGGSSGGSAAAVAGGLVPFATATDGGGSTRQPAAFCGLPGLKVTWRLIPAGPEAIIEPLTVVVTALTRSVRDLARILDVSAGFDRRDPFSLLPADDFEAALGTVRTQEVRVAFVPDFGGAHPSDDVASRAEDALGQLVDAGRLRRVDLPETTTLRPPDERLAAAVSLRLRRWLGSAWPACEASLTEEVRAALEASFALDLDALANVDSFRTETIEAIAEVFEVVDLVATPTTTGEAFAAEGPAPVGEGSALWPANVSGCPAISIPIGTGAEGLPIGLQLLGPHGSDRLLLHLAYEMEKVRPWPLTAPA
jgi:Asp-tRNA(Asn)/Glu-tRNA(Gln) amidotransferase A subunit family amidase